MSNVLAFKLIGGDEVVADVIKTVTVTLDGPIQSYIVRKPHILKFQPVAPGEIGLAFVPWTLSNPGILKLEIPASAVLLTFEPDANVERQYLSQTSGIALG